MLRRRSIVRDAVGVEAGERVLDLGCGPGFYVAELQQQVGPEGSVVGIDMSAPMLALAARRTEGRDNVELHEASATDLPFEDARFDAAVCVQVLEYVADVDAALAECRRVLRPGGRLVVWDVDWATASMHSADPPRMDRVLEAWDRHLAHRSLPRTLTGSLRDAGFEDVSLVGHSFTTNEFVPDAYGAFLVSMIETYLVGLDDFGEDEARAWADEQRELGERGQFYFACVQCCVSATRAPA